MDVAQGLARAKPALSPELQPKLAGKGDSSSEAPLFLTYSSQEGCSRCSPVGEG